MDDLVQDVDLSFKIIVVGNGGVGKTSLIQKFCNGVFLDDYKKTIGVDFLEKEFWSDRVDSNVTLMLWDTAGQEEFDSITKSYYRGAAAAVVVFSTIDRDSFDAVRGWVDKVTAEVGPEILLVLVQNKIDVMDSEEACVSEEDGDELADELSCQFFRCSVKETLNIDEVFEYIIEQVTSEQEGVVLEPEVVASAATSRAVHLHHQKGSSEDSEDEEGDAQGDGCAC